MGYYESGAVTELSRTEGGYRALVEGTEDYEVEIEIKDNRILDMRCTCPYAGDGKYCKHMAAVLYRQKKGEVWKCPMGPVKEPSGIPDRNLRR